MSIVRRQMRGRERELEHLDALADTPGLVVVVGPPGVGKTTTGAVRR